jgi:hypothetical protein
MPLLVQSIELSRNKTQDLVFYGEGRPLFSLKSLSKKEDEDVQEGANNCEEPEESRVKMRTE